MAMIPEKSRSSIIGVEPLFEVHLGWAMFGEFAVLAVFDTTFIFPAGPFPPVISRHDAQRQDAVMRPHLP